MTDRFSARSPLVASILGGFLAAAVLDAASMSVEAPRADLRTSILEALYAAGHVLALGVLVAAATALAGVVGPRIHGPARRRAAGAAWAGLIAVGGGLVVLAIDLSVFTAPLRIACFAAAGLPPAVLVSTRGVLGRSRIAGLLLALIGAALVAIHPRVLDGSYAGLHVYSNAIAGLTLGLAIERAAAWVRAPRPLRWVALVITVVGAAAAVAVPPSNDVRVALARRQSSTLFAFLPHLRAVGPTTRDPLTVAEHAWFDDRSSAAPIRPTTPPLLADAPIVVLVSVDAMRADTLDGDEPATARVRALAAEGARFTLARSPASATSPAIAALMTGKYYSSLRWTMQAFSNRQKYFLAEEATPRFAELVAASGAETRLTNPTTGLLPQHGLTRGFETVSRFVASAEDAMDVIVSWLDGEHPNGMLVYAHLLDAHAPYDKIAQTGTPKERYLAELATVDAQIGRLADAIEARGLWGRTFLVVTADHGEAFGEHGTSYHASTIYEELVRVPLVVRGPGIAPRRIGEPVSLVDLGATILDLFQLDTPGAWMGQSLVPLLRGREVTLTRPIVLDTGRRIQGLVGRDGIKVIRNVRAGTFEVYDLFRDPAESKNLVGTPVATAALGRLASFFDVHELTEPGYEIPFRD